VKAKRNWLVPAIILAVILVCNTFPWLYTSAALNWARREGVYATPKEGVRARANRWFCDVERVNINLASTNSFDGSNPHVRYVTWTVYAKSHSPCDGMNLGEPLYNQTYQGGQFYLSTKDGWVMMPEELFPEYIGYWMKVFNLAGPGEPTHIPRE
jgi:hypothetical protein